MELATHHAKELSTTAANASIQRVDKTTGKAHTQNSKKGPGGQKCYRCGKKNHKASDCYRSGHSSRSGMFVPDLEQSIPQCIAPILLDSNFKPHFNYCTVYF